MDMEKILIEFELRIPVLPGYSSELIAYMIRNNMRIEKLGTVYVEGHLFFSFEHQLKRAKDKLLKRIEILTNCKPDIIKL